MPQPSRQSHAASHLSASLGNPFGIAPHSNSAQSNLFRTGDRRWFLQAGLGGMMGLSLPALLKSRAQAAEAGSSTKPTSVILIWLSGGPSHIDMWDMKPQQPAEIRGPFSPISTSVPGLQLCEHLPKQASMAEKFAIIRSMDASSSNHTPITFQAGNPKARRTNDGRDGGGYPSMGSVTAKFRGPNQPGMPGFVALADSLGSDCYGAGELGNQYEPLDGMKVQGRFSLPTGIAAPRLQDRNRLRQEFDRMRRQVESSRSLALQDRYVQEAYNMVLSGSAEKAFDLNNESDAVRDLYGRHSFGQKSLLSRRLVEAGVPFVMMSDAWGHWDHHGDEVKWGGIERGLKPMLPVLDHGITTLVTDLEQRGLLDSTLVLILGEFGRGPVMTKTAGRGHWTQVMSMLAAGGGVQGGKVIGATDRRGGGIVDHRLGPGDLAATVFRHLGIDPGDHWLNPAGRPVPLVEGDARPIDALYS